MAQFGQALGMSKKPTNYLDVMKQKEEPKKFNLFDFSSVKTQQPTQTPQMNFGQPVSQRNVTNFSDYKQTIPQQTQPTKKSGFSLIPTANAMEEEKDLIQSFLDDNNVNVENRKTVFEMLKDNVPKNVIEDAIINKAGYKGTQPTQESFIEGVGTKTKESFLGGIKRIGEAGVGLAEGKYNIPEAFARGGAGALQTTFSPISGLLGETIQTGVENIPQGFKDYISQKTKPTIEDVKMWYNTQTPEQKRQLQNIGVGVELLSNFIGASAVTKATPILKQGAVKTGEVLTKGGKQILKTPTLIKQGINKTSDLIDTGIEKTATKMLGSSDGTKELFKATSPSYNTLSKSKDITKIVDSAKKADETIIQYGFKPKNTSERVTAYKDTMKKVWSDIEKTRGGVETKVDAGNIAKIIDDEVSKLSVGGVINPAIQKDVTALLKQADYFKKIGKVDIPTLGNQRTLLNAITDWGQTTEYGNTFSNIMKKVNSQIKQIEDDIITQAGKGTTGDKLKQYGALRNMYDDIVKQDIKALRAKGMAIDESFGRISGISEALGGIAQLFTNPKQALPTMLSGGAKLLLGKTAGKLKDTDFLIKTGYDKLSKTLKSNLKKNVDNVDNNIISPTKYSTKPTKVSGQTQIKPSILSDREKALIKPNQPTNVSNKPIIKPKKIGGEVLKKILPSNFKEKAQDLVDKVADKVGARSKLLGGEGAKQVPTNLEKAKNWEKSGKSADDIWKETGWEKGTDGKWKFEIDDSKANISINNEKELTDLIVKNLKGKGSTDLFIGDILKHDNLFKQYPQIKDIKVIFDNRLEKEGAWGSYSPYFKELTINPKRLNSPEELKSTLLHEIQHNIQEIENFGKGGSPELGKIMEKELGNKISEFNTQLSKLAKENKIDEYNIIMDKKLKVVKELVNIQDDYGISGYEGYKKLAGETEARNIQSRLLKTPAENKGIRPAKTEDVAREKQIIKMEGGLSNLLPTNSKQVSNTKNKYFKKEKEFITENGKVEQYSFQGDKKKGDLTYTHTKEGYKVNNIFIPDEMQGKGLGTNLYKDLNIESYKNTGKTLYTKERKLLNGNYVSELSDASKGLWEGLVRKGYANKIQGGYRFKTPNEIIQLTKTIPTNSKQVSKVSDDINERVIDLKGKIEKYGFKFENKTQDRFDNKQIFTNIKGPNTDIDATIRKIGNELNIDWFMAKDLGTGDPKKLVKVLELQSIIDGIERIKVKNPSGFWEKIGYKEGIKTKYDIANDLGVDIKSSKGAKEIIDIAKQQLKQIYEQANKPKLIKPQVSKVSDDLISEAKKYKSADDIKTLPTKDFVGMEDINGLEKLLEKSGKDKEKWAKGFDFKEPVEVSISKEGDFTISDGHHRVLAGKILNKEIPVIVKSRLQGDLLGKYISLIKKGYKRSQIYKSWNEGTFEEQVNNFFDKIKSSK